MITIDILHNIVINDIYYNFSDIDGYDATEGCIVINNNTDMNNIVDGTPGSDDVKANFNGIIIEVNGFGLIEVDCQTLGAMQLCVKVGDGEPTMITKSERGTVQVSYNVTEPTYVYIYAASTVSAPQRVSASENCVKLWSLSVKPGATDIRPVDKGKLTMDEYYSLDGQKLTGKPATAGVYITGGRKVIVK